MQASRQQFDEAAKTLRAELNDDRPWVRGDIQRNLIRLAMVRKLLADALAPVRVLDSRTIKTLEPAVTFRPTREVGND